MKRSSYLARVTPLDDITRSPELHDLAQRRIIPFLDRSTHLSIEHLMREAYIQGIRDAAQAVS